MERSFLEIDSVSKRYTTARGGSVEALRDINLMARQGEFVALVGPSGCGKSTLLKMVAGLLTVDEGAIRLGGDPGQGAGETDRAVKVGMVFQRASLFSWLSVLDNVLAPIRLAGESVCPHVEHARDLLRLTGLEGFENRYPRELSGGMQQRASICRALVWDPELLLMDEPFAALDAFTRDKLNVELLRIWEASRKTVLFVTHNIAEAVFLADRVIVLGPRPGRILDDIRITLPRPRTAAVRASEEFGRLNLQVYGYFSDTAVEG